MYGPIYGEFSTALARIAKSTIATLAIFVEVVVSKKFLSVTIAGAVLATSLVIGVAPANAAVAKANAACAKANSSAKISGITFKCTFNPIATVKKLTWVAQPCLDANVSYKTALSLTTSISSSYEGRLTSATRLKTNAQKLIAAAQKNVDKWSADLAAYLAKHPTVATTGTDTDKKMVKQVEDGIALNKQRVIDQTANLAKLDQQIADATAGAAKVTADADTAKTSLVSACK